MSCQPACATCEQLRAAALQIVGDVGIGALSHESLVARVGLSPQEAAAHYPVLDACLYETYDEEASELVRTVVGAFEDEDDWESGFGRSRAHLIEWLLAHPAGARLLFVEAVRGNRELRRRRELSRRQIVGFFRGQYARSAEGDGVPALQIELLIGAGFQLISGAVAEGDPEAILELEHKLAELEGFFIPTPV